MKINYRPAVIKDLDSIVEIYNCIIDERGFTADLDKFTVADKLSWFEETNSNLFGVFVVCIDDKIIGYFYFTPWRKGRRALQHVVEISFYLSKAFRGSGIGNQILNWIIDEASEKKFTVLIAILLDVNERSRILLEKFNFKETGQLKNIANINGSFCGQWIMIRFL